MAILNVIGWEAGDSTEANATTGTFSVQTTTVRTGGYALRVNPAAGAAGDFRVGTQGANGTNSAFTASTTYARFYFRAATLPSGDPQEVFVFLNSLAQYKAAIRITNAGAFQLYDSTGTAQIGSTGATTINTNTWYMIEASCGTGASAAAELRINGSPEISATGNLRTSTGGFVSFGKRTTRATDGNTVDFYYDDAIIDDAQFHGPGQVVRMDPNGAGNYTDGTGAYTDVDDIPHDSDTTYWTSSTSGHAFTVAIESASDASISGTIRCVKAHGVVRDEGGASSLALRLRSGSTDSNTTSADHGSSYLTLGKLFATDPADSTQWTTTKLGNIEVGAVLAASVAHRVTSLCAMVEFTPAVPRCEYHIENTPIGKKVTFTWQTDSTGSVSRAMTEEINGTLVQLETYPFDSPTDNYDITLIGQYGEDALLGRGGNRDTATPEITDLSSTSDPYPNATTEGLHTFTVTNAGNSTKGQVVLYYREARALPAGMPGQGLFHT